MNKIKVSKIVVKDKIYFNIEDIENYDPIDLYSAFTYNLPNDQTAFTIDDSDEPIIAVPKNAHWKLDFDSIEDKRVFPPINKLNFTGQLRKEQQLTVNNFFNKDGQVLSGLLQAKCGKGKTYMGAYIISKAKTRTLILVHTKLLFYQWFNELSELLPNTPIGLVGDGKYNLENITVGLYKTVSNNLDNLKKLAGLVIVDEAHHCPATIFNKLVNNMYNKVSIALTATPKRKDGLHVILPDIFGTRKIILENYEENQEVKSVTVNIIKMPINIKVPPQDVKRQWVKHINALGANIEYINAVANILNKKILEDRCILVVSDRVDFLKTLDKKVKKSVLLIGGTSSEDRELILKLAGKKYKVILSTTIFDEGVSCHRLDTLVFTFPFNNLGKLEQRIGRLERDHDDKQPLEVLDFWFKGKIVENQQRQRLGYYTNKKYEINTLEYVDGKLLATGGTIKNE